MFTTTREAGLLLRDLREQAGDTQTGLAARAGVSVRWLINFEGGKPSVDMSKVADCFQVLGYAFEVVPLVGQRAR
jgi:transcriptional regulator with XRE-family HTH domain